MPSAESKNGAPWSDDELRACAAEYVEMQAKQAKGNIFNKVEVHRRLVAGPLAGRTMKSVEYRMQNLSAVVEARGGTIVQGYLPARNVGANVTARLEAALDATILYGLPSAAATADDAELRKRAKALLPVLPKEPPRGIENPVRQAAVREVYVRDPAVRAHVLREANGSCELCGSPAPFVDSDGSPFLELHHVRPLAEGGSDQVTNAAALCPNCHRRCHYDANPETVRQLLLRRIGRLIPE